MTYKLKNIIYFVLVYSIFATNYATARSEHKITCGNGKTVKVSDSQAGNAAKACLRAGHPAPKKKIRPTMKRGMISSQKQAKAKDNGKWDPNSARLPKGKQKIKSKCKYDKNSAVLPTGPCKDKKPSSLLLPAVQAAVGGSRCGSDSSISRALDQCGKKGFKFALCKKNRGKWSCTPSGDKSNPKVRPTGIANRTK
ncbi:MAG TPA: hypothetical protein ENJ51_09745 [Leucothrix mucor]|uniref:Uncharacterized protein n=1 Tax=Leucothrix mucor TaxID=45248 RepID=A0A7V2WVE4_LEUMU|nr:hypothetical protein [Leucothrix mucor]